MLIKLLKRMGGLNGIMSPRIGRVVLVETAAEGDHGLANAF